jgi:hypothetical protein
MLFATASTARSWKDFPLPPVLSPSGDGDGFLYPYMILFSLRVMFPVKGSFTFIGVCGWAGLSWGLLACCGIGVCYCCGLYLVAAA